MAGEWTAAKLGDLCDFRAGSVFKPLFQGCSSGDYPFVKVSDMNLSANAVLIQGAKNWISNADLCELRARPLPPGTVIFAKIGEALRQNRLRQVVRETIVDNNMMGAVPYTDRIDARYFYYALSQFDFSEIAHGTALPYLTVSSLSALTLNLPPLSEQRAIAHILGTLDDRIEANRRMAATLEEMARALFRAWFVTFEPVRAKAEGRWRPGQTLPGLPASLYDTFPDRLVETEHGEIPEGWRWWLLEELAVLHRASLSPGAEPDRVFEHYSIPAYDNGQEPVQDRGETIKSNKTLVPADAILLSKLNPESNRVWLPKAESAHPKIASTEFLCFTPKAPAGRALLYSAFRGEPFRRALEGMVTGTSKSHQRVSPDSVLRLQVCPARREVFDGFEKQVWPLLDRTNACREESRILISIRDALLPKLVSGAIRVKDAEAFLKARGL